MFFRNYEEARSHLICRLASPENEALLRKVPFCRAFADLLAVPCFYEIEQDGRAAGYPVTLFQAAQWGVEPGRMLQDAVGNMQRLLPPVLNPMSSLMESSMTGSVRNQFLFLLKKKFWRTADRDLDQVALLLARRAGRQIEEERGLERMWVLGNGGWLFGASSLLFPGVLQGFGEKTGKNFFILPSSIHEVILLPEGGTETQELLYSMVRSANAKISPDKFLSEHVYYYDRINMEIQTLKK